MKEVRAGAVVPFGDQEKAHSRQWEQPVQRRLAGALVCLAGSEGPVQLKQSEEVGGVRSELSQAVWTVIRVVAFTLRAQRTSLS